MHRLVFVQHWAGPGAFNPHDPFGGYVFLGAEGRYVARNIFLDGNTFDDDGPSVSGRRRWVGDIQTGIGAELGAVSDRFYLCAQDRTIHRTRWSGQIRSCFHLLCTLISIQGESRLIWLTKAYKSLWRSLDRLK